jgi:hypothetical protein
VVPLCDFGVREQRVVATGEASLQTLRDIIVEWKVCTKGIIRVLPVAILRLVDRLTFVSSNTLNGKLQTIFDGVYRSSTSLYDGKGLLTNHSSTR